MFVTYTKKIVFYIFVIQTTLEIQTFGQPDGFPPFKYRIRPVQWGIQTSD